MSDPLDRLRRALTEEFGNIYETYGLARLKGLIVGLLLAHEEPLSLDDITEKLGRSKGPISQTVRELTLAGLIHKTEGDNSRRDYYVADADLFLNNFRRNMRTVAKNRSAAEYFLAELDRMPEDDEGLRHNLEQMRAFYALMGDFYGRFEEQWQTVRPNGKEQ